MKRRLDHVSHLESTVTGTLLVDNARIQLLSFLYKILHVRHPSYLFSLFHFALSARTRNLTVPPHRTLAMSQSFVVLGCRAWNSLPHDVKRLPTHGRFVSAVVLDLFDLFYCFWFYFVFDLFFFLFGFFWHIDALDVFLLGPCLWSRMVGYSDRHLVKIL
jgi:hypothetical protein